MFSCIYLTPTWKKTKAKQNLYYDFIKIIDCLKFLLRYVEIEIYHIVLLFEQYNDEP